MRDLIEHLIVLAVVGVAAVAVVAIALLEWTACYYLYCLVFG